MSSINITVPSRDKCLELLKTYKTPTHVINHCKAVSEIALQIAKALNDKGCELNLGLIEAAALLHDIARVEDNHGLKGAMIAEKHGYNEVAELIKLHMYYITDPYKERLNEQDILCLADRMVKEDEYVGLEVRMQYVLDKFKGNKEATERIMQRLEENRILKSRIEKIIDMKMDQLMSL